MLATAKNYDVICLQMRNYLPQQERGMKNETNRFVGAVKAIIENGTPVKPKLDQFIPDIFKFRMQALKWMAKQPDVDLQGLMDTTLPAIESLQGNQRLAQLGENMMFAMRCNMRVINAMMGKDVITSEQLAEQFEEAPVTYEQFLGTLALSIPDEGALQIIADWLHASLYIEFILLAGVLIVEENLAVAGDTINELAFLVADAAQEYFAIATQMGLFPARSKTLPTANLYDSCAQDEDKLLSDLGLADFALNF